MTSMLLAAALTLSTSGAPSGGGSGPHPLSTAISFHGSPFDALHAAEKVVADEGLGIDMETNDGSILLTKFAPVGDQQLRFKLQFSPELLLLRAEPQRKSGRKWRDLSYIDPAPAEVMDRLTVALRTAVAALPPAAAQAATATPGPPASAFEAARRAIESCGLRIASANEAGGRLETEWHQGQSSMFGSPDYTIEFRVRYVVQVSGRTASARAEIEKSTDHRSWLPRAEATREENEQLEKLRHALQAALDALPR